MARQCKELRAVFIAFRQKSIHSLSSVRVLSGNTPVVNGLNHQGTSRSSTFFEVSNLLLVHRRSIYLKAAHLVGTASKWTGALSRQVSSTVEWHLKQSLFAYITYRFLVPHINLFVTRENGLPCVPSENT